MRESIGALSIFSIVMTFIVLFTAYLAISVNYANAFRVKNNLVSAIENHEGIDGNDTQFLDDVLLSQNYDVFDECPAPGSNEYNRRIGAIWGNPIPVGENNGRARACVYRRTVGNMSGNNASCEISYYKVMVFFKMDLPIIGDLLTMPVKGDTRGVYDRADTNCVQLAA